MTWLYRLLQALRRWLAGAPAWVRRWLERILGYGDYDPRVWRWDRRRRRWVLRDSEEGGSPKSYNCTEYCIARIRGEPPRWGGDGSQTTETDEIEARLGDLGWVTGDCRCGLGPGENRDCVVVYIAQGQVVHAAILDKVRGDWGGKLGPGSPIGRFRRPEDYYPDGRVPDGESMRFYCARTPLTEAQLTDEELHRRATEL